jgi:L-ascorbate metabolism protein UlaG (beta-lactamase superfamily)
MAKVSIIVLFAAQLMFSVTDPSHSREFETDVINTAEGDLEITFIGHGSLMFLFNGIYIHVDPDSRLADYGSLPKADIVLVTHEHKDHFDPTAIEILRKEKTVMVVNPAVGKELELENVLVMRNGDEQVVAGIKIEAVPAYNLVHMRPEGVPYHPKGNGNGYIISFSDTRVYVAGDTENIPEMQELKNINLAFLPMNLPYTMSPQMAADAAKSFMPEILYPYHYGDTDTLEIIDLLKNSEIEVRVRSMR